MADNYRLVSRTQHECLIDVRCVQCHRLLWRQSSLQVLRRGETLETKCGSCKARILATVEGLTLQT